MWNDFAKNKAADILADNLDIICEYMLKDMELIIKGELERNITVYLDEWDNCKEYSLVESAEILEELWKHEETDQGIFLKKGDMKKSF